MNSNVTMDHAFPRVIIVMELRTALTMTMSQTAVSRLKLKNIYIFFYGFRNNIVLVLSEIAWRLLFYDFASYKSHIRFGVAI